MEEEVKTELEAVEEVTEPTEDTADESPDDYSADIEPDDEADEEDKDFELEYDDEGNVVIAGDDDESEEEGDTTPSEDATPDDTPAEHPTAPAERESAEDRYRRAYEVLLEHARAATKKMGYEGDNVLDNLDQMGAEADGKIVEDYRAELKSESDRKAAEAADLAARFAAKKAADLAAVHAAYPDAKKYTDVDQFPNSQRFKALCDAGATPEEAFRATHPEEIAAHVAAAVKAGARDSKDHIRSNVPRGAKDNSVHISRAEMDMYREMFPGISDKEIIRKYRDVTKK